MCMDPEPAAAGFRAKRERVSLVRRVDPTACRVPNVRLIGQETCPLPEDPWLAAAAAALNEGGFWAEVVDPEWRGVYMTDDARRIYGHRLDLASYPMGVHIYGPERVDIALEWRGGQFPMEINRRLFALFGPLVLADTPGGRDELRRVVHPELRDLVDGMLPVETPAISTIK